MAGSMSAYEVEPKDKAKDDAKSSKTVDLDAVHKEAMDRWRKALEAERDNINEGYNDLKFYAGEQWEPEARKQREDEGRPCLTINMLPQFAKQITGDIRQSKPAIRVVPIDDTSDPATAEVIEGIIRNIENGSDAKAAYFNALDRQVVAGMGHWRVTSDYIDDDTDEQELKVEPIRDVVLWDPDATSATRQDAMFCFVPELLTKDAFEERFGDNVMSSMPTKDTSYDLGWWYQTDNVMVSEYWCKKPYKKMIGTREDGTRLDITGFTQLQREQAGVVSMKERTGYKVCYYLMSGSEILEGPTEWPGKHIPIVPVLGEEIHLERRTVRISAIRHAKPAQQLYNYWASANAEYVALQPKAPFVGTDKNFAKYKAIWQEANRKNQPFLPYEPDERNGGQSPQRSNPPVSSSGMLEGLQLAREDMRQTTGIYDAGLGNKSNETSGKAILARQREGDTANFVFFDNFSRAVAYTGQIILDLIPHFYDTQRIVRILGKDGVERYERINAQVVGPDGMPTFQFDLSTGKYDVLMETGPSFASRRDEARDGMERLMGTNPQAALVFMDLYAKALDWPFADEIAERLKKMNPALQAEGEEPTPEAMQAEQAKQELAMRGAQAEVAEKEASAAEKMARAQKALSEAQPVDPAVAAMEAQTKRAELAVKQQELSLRGEELLLQREQLAMQASGVMAGAAVQNDVMARIDAEMQEIAKALMAIPETLAQQGAQQSQATEMLIRALTAPKTVIRDPKTGALRSEVVMN